MAVRTKLIATQRAGQQVESAPENPKFERGSFKCVPGPPNLSGGLTFVCETLNLRCCARNYGEKG
eukprot:37629-Rhodomonas_salina.1